MIFISLAKFRKKPDKEFVARASKGFAALEAAGIKILGQYWTLGRYDAVVITQARNEKEAMKAIMKFGDMAATETMVAIPRSEAIKLVD